MTHDLRHFYASALIAGGAGVKQIQLVLGHASAVITLRIYARLWPGEDVRTRAVRAPCRRPGGPGAERRTVR